MRFGIAQSKKFGTDLGSYSVVTSREDVDSQITLTDYESKLLCSHFGVENIHVGNVGQARDRAAKSFRLYPSGNFIQLNVVFPKPEKTELRLYLSAKSGFRPGSEYVWFLFVLDTDIWIGAMPESVWRFECSELRKDETDYAYQESLELGSEIRISTSKARDIFVRDRRIALQRMQLSGFRCEYNSSHSLFISRFSRKEYLEAHHLVPMSLQGSFSKPLDSLCNVFCLCPNCHRAVHHAEVGQAREILQTLAGTRDVLTKYNLGIEDLYTLYSVEIII